jgi:DHA1 family multidrug resistance protein-like MFS transporter
MLTVAYRATSIMLQTTVPLYAKYVLGGSDFTVSVIAGAASVMPIASLLYMTLRGIDLNHGLPLTLAFVAVSLPLFLFARNNIALLAISSFAFLWTGPASVLLLTSVIMVSTPEKREHNIFLFTAMLSISLALSPLFQSAILQLASDNLAYSMALYSPFIAVPLLFYPFAKIDKDLKLKTTFDPGFLRNRSYLMGVVSSVMFSIPFAILLTFGGIFSKNEFQAGYNTIEALFTLFFVVSLSVRLGLIRSKASRFKLVSVMICTTSVGLGVVSASFRFWQLVLGFLLLGCSHGLYYPTASNFIAESTSSYKLTAANSVWFVTDTLIISTSLPVMGWLIELFGIRPALLFVEIPVVVLGLVFLRLARGYSSPNPPTGRG